MPLKKLYHKRFITANGNSAHSLIVIISTFFSFNFLAIVSFFIVMRQFGK